MIQLTKKLAALAPDRLTNQGAVATESLKLRYDNGERAFDFDSKIYGHDEVKQSLITLQDGKCAFCEAKIRHISWGDVEHFRPKGGWVQEDEPVNVPGYYWLAYNWENLVLSCQICNQRYKKNYFPLAANSPRALSHHDDVNNEQCLFIHPGLDNPETFIEFNEEIPRAVSGNLRGAITIKHTGIDREALNEHRRTKLGMVRSIYKLALGYPDTNPQLKQDALDEVRIYYDQSNLEETEYSSMLKSFFRANPLP